MTFTTAEIILIITTLTTSIVTIIGAIKLKAIAHSVNSASSLQVAKMDARDETIKALTKALADEQETAKLLAQSAGKPRTTRRGDS